MKRNLALISFGLLACVACSANNGEANPIVDGVKNTAGYVGDTVGGTATAVGGAVSGAADRVTGKVDPALAKQEINRNTEAALARLFKADRKAKALFDISYGYAVFDSRKGSFLVTVGQGSGVAVSKANNNRTYMRMLTGGANLGAGIQFYQTVFLFENKTTFDRFVNSGWEAGSAANANFGRDSLDVDVRFTNGMALFQLAETGINLSVDVTGTKYWKDNALS